MYHENIANKGANEMCSLSLHYIENNIGPYKKHLYLVFVYCQGKKKSTLYLDLCWLWLTPNGLKKMIFSTWLFILSNSSQFWSHKKCAKSRSYTYALK